MINLDWLQFSAKLIEGTELKAPTGYELKFVCETGLFRIVETLHMAGEVVATIQRMPRKGSPIPQETIIVKLDNRILYTRDCDTYIDKLCRLLKIVWIKWGRIDISYDFTSFKNYSETPEQFIRNFISGTILKKQRNKSQFKVLGKVHNTFTRSITKDSFGNSIEYLKFGTYQCDISYYMYNKTLEFIEKGKKPHIIKCWKKSGINTKMPVWRLEFSIKNFNKSLVYASKKGKNDPQSGEVVSYFKEREFIRPENIEQVFQFLYWHYMFFVNNIGENLPKISRRERIELLPIGTYNASRMRLVDVHQSRDETRSARIFLKKLDETNNEVREAKNMYEHNALSEVMMKLIKRHSIEEWATNKISSLSAQQKEEIRKLSTRKSL